MNFLWVLQRCLVGYSWFYPSWFNPPRSKRVILCCDSILTAVTIICWAHLFRDRLYYYLTNIGSVRYCVNSVVFIFNNTYSRKASPQGTMWLQICVWSEGVSACGAVFDFFQVTVLLEGVVQSMVFLLHAGKSIIASGPGLFVCVGAHIFMF